MARFLRLLVLFAAASTLVLILYQAKTIPAADVVRDTESPAESPPPPSIQAGAPVKTEDVPAAQGAAKSTRNVGGGAATAPLNDQAMLERLDPVPQPTPPTTPKAAEAQEPKTFWRWRLVYNSVATSAGVFQTNESALVLPGIDIVSTTEKCVAPDGRSWPCGMVARTALRSFINGKALTCKLPDVPKDKSFEADCLLRGRDLGEWLVTSGWARAKVDGPYVDLQTNAQQARRGIFGTPPQGLTTATP
ncbi:MAG: thermonuclease family protein [Rhizobiaceae bacterium]